jgi:hypothetical protein
MICAETNEMPHLRPHKKIAHKKIAHKKIAHRAQEDRASSAR